jgi:hypothetical protein
VGEKEKTEGNRLMKDSRNVCWFRAVKLMPYVETIQALFRRSSRYNRRAVIPLFSAAPDAQNGTEIRSILMPRDTGTGSR